MELVVLVIAGVVVYYVVTRVAGWWSGYRERHNVPLRVAALTGVLIVAGWVSQSSTGARAADRAIGGVLLLALLAVAVLAVAGWRRGRSRQATESQAAARSWRPVVERSPSGRNSEANAPVAPRPVVERSPSGRNSEANAPVAPRSLVERSLSGRNSEANAPVAPRPPAQRSTSTWNSVYNEAGREIFVYAFGAFDNRSGECRKIKIGSSTAPELRLAQVQDEQVGRTDTARTLGKGPGGERRESMMLRRLNEWRYPESEWFEASPEVLAEIAKLERLTEDGRRLTQAPATRSA